MILMWISFVSLVLITIELIWIRSCWNISDGWIMFALTGGFTVLMLDLGQSKMVDANLVCCHRWMRWGGGGRAI